MDDRGLSGSVGPGGLAHLDVHGVRLCDPEAVDRQAGALGTRAEGIRTTARLLRDVSVAQAWESPSGSTLAARVGSVPATLDDVAERLEDIASVLTRHASALRTHLAELDRIERRHDETAAELDLVIAQARSTVGEDVVMLQARWDELDADVRAHQRAFEDELQAAIDSDGAVATALDQQVSPTLDDSWQYDALEGLEGVGRTADSAGWLAALPPLKAVQGGLSAMGWGATVTRKGVYGHGPSWGRIGAQGAGKATNLLARHGAPFARELAGTPLSSVTRSRARAVWSKPRNPAPGRSGSSVHRAPGWRGAVRHHAATVGRKARSRFGEETGLTTVHQVRQDWQAVAGSSTSAQVVVVATSAARLHQHAQRVDKRVASASEVRSRLEGTPHQPDAAADDGERTAAGR